MPFAGLPWTAIRETCALLPPDYLNRYLLEWE